MYVSLFVLYCTVYLCNPCYNPVLTVPGYASGGGGGWLLFHGAAVRWKHGRRRGAVRQKQEAQAARKHSHTARHGRGVTGKRARVPGWQDGREKNL